MMQEALPNYRALDWASFVRSGNRKSWLDVTDTRWENLGTGWQGVESFSADPRICYRWSKQEAVVYLWNPFEAGRLALDALCPAIPAAKPSAFLVSINGKPLARVKVASDQWEEISLDYRAAIGPVEIRLRTEKTWHRNGQSAAHDIRSFGYGFRRMTLKPDCSSPVALGEISVVIPTYNRIDKLLSVLGALEAQTLDKQRFEVIVVDDGSSDGTKVKVWQYAQSSSLSLQYFQQQHGLQGAARNLGIQHATKPIILFLGDDIIPDPRLLEQHLLLHAKNGNNSRVAVLGHTDWAKHLRVTPFMNYIGRWGAQFGYALTKEDAPLTFNFFYTSNVSVSREILQEQPYIFDEEFQSYGWEDTELAYRLEKAGMQLWYNPRAVAYHDHPVTMREFCRRQHVVGRSSRLFIRKHPSIEASMGLPDDLYGRLRQGLLVAATEKIAGLVDGLLRIPLPRRFYEMILQRHYAAGALAAIKAETDAGVEPSLSPEDSLEHEEIPSVVCADAAGPLRRTTKVHLYLYSGGNEFLRDIAEMFQDGFKRLGLETALCVDQIPDISDPNVLRILVAPHELFPLFLERKLKPDRLEEIVGRCHLLCTEQPESVWFERSVKYALMAKGVFDINRQAMRELRRGGIAAVYTPLGYTPLLKDGCNSRGGEDQTPASVAASPEAAGDEPSRNVDIVFLGHCSPKRDRFLAEHAEKLQKYNCRLIFASLDKIRLATTKGYYGRSRRNRLLQRSKILVNLHSSGSDYFEWHRVLPCLANGCLVISEASEDYAPLVGGEHLELCRLEEIMDRCEHYLQREDERAAMARRAHDFLRNSLGIEASCRTMCEHRLPPWERTGRNEAFALGGALSASAQPLTARLGHRVRALARRTLLACRQRAAQRPLIRRAYLAARSLYRAHRDRTVDRDFQRTQDDFDLVSAPGAGGASTAARWERFYNASYAGSPTPSVSVVIACRNDSRSIARCLTSIADSCRDGVPRGIEAIVVDDASTDRSLEIAQETADRCGFPICVVKRHKSAGLANTRNLGIELARAPHVLCLDADGWIFPNCIARLYETITSSGAEAAYAMVKRIDRRSGKSLGVMSQYDWDVQRLIASHYLHGTAMFDRARLLALGGYSRDLAGYGCRLEDYDLWLKLAQAGCQCAFRAEILSAGCWDGMFPQNVPADRLPAIVAHFEREFSELLARYPDETMRFGRPVTVKIKRFDKGEVVARPHWIRAGSKKRSRNEWIDAHRSQRLKRNK